MIKTSIFVTIVLGFVVRRVVQWWERSKEERTIATSHGCQPANPIFDPLGIRRTLQLWGLIQKNSLPLYGDIVFKKHGRHTIPTSDLGRPGFYTSDPRNVQAVLTTNFKDFGLGKSRHPLIAFLGEGLFVQDGEAWAHSRSILRPSFVRSQIADFNMLEGHCQTLMEIIKHLSFPAQEETITGTGKVFDFGSLLADLTMDFSTHFLLGESAGVLAGRATNVASRGPPNEENEFSRCFSIGMANCSKRMNLGTWHDLWNPKSFRIACRKVHGFVDRYVDRAISLHQAKTERGSSVDGDDRYVFLEALAGATQDPVVLRSQIMNILVAGRDTTTALLSWIFWELSRKPEVFQTLRNEIEQNFGLGSASAIPTWQGLKDMRYLRAVINECLRCYPPAPYSNREALRATWIPAGGGHDGQSPLLVPKGYNVVYGICTMHRRQDIWGDDANEFRPERWLTADIGKNLREIGWGFLPFNGGPRVCPGQQFALTEASYVVTRVLQQICGITKGIGCSDVPSYATSIVAPPAEGVWVCVDFE